MADLSDATSGLASAVASVLFSSPYSFGASVASVLTWPLDDAAISTGAIIDLYPGWPAAEALTADLVAGHAHVSVFAEKDQTRDATRYQPQWRASPAVAPTLTAVLFGDVISFGGTASPRQVVGLLVDHGVSAGSYAYRCLATDTPASLAATLAAAIKGASCSGNSLTVTGDSISVSVVCDQGATMELRRQIQGFRVSCWAPNPAARDIIAGAIDAALADMPWITLADGSAGRLLYRSTDYDDRISADRVWQRDLCYTIEYATQARQIQPVMLFPGTTINGSGTVMVPASGNVLAGPAPIPGLIVSNAVLAVS